MSLARYFARGAGWTRLAGISSVLPFPQPADRQQPSRILRLGDIGPGISSRWVAVDALAPARRFRLTNRIAGN